ncbi:HlyD family type I secretion periplasmic adaptor subunit [Sphingomonas sp. SRS2]|uniref:HlyD family type I secretion periplasmic adaptor subunit n=1 Tax=Sphingomonas sp. SRS2 TaxID=133190 RepID=UPI000618489A|nr:HlyD family type I secretion periplasmic adaptor subunit [Sphingomonas sp. SRS2]KKC26960.1 secretion protein HlyD [Sphingomonas sp. SRS2]
MKLLSDFRRLLRREEPEVDADSDESAVAYVSGNPADDAQLRKSLQRPIIAGSIVVGLLVLTMVLWAFLSISGAVLAPGTVRVENNSKDIRRLEGGIVRQILVREGQRVAKGQVLIRFDDTQSKASVDVYQSNVDSALANIARFQAEAANASDISFPPQLLSRSAEPAVAALMDTQRSLFQTRTLLYRSQAQVLRSQASQVATQLTGLRVQAQAIDDQTGLIQQELRDVRELSRQGYAPETRRLALERNAVNIRGQRGSMTAEMARARQSIGEIQLQIAQLENKHQTEVADGIRAAQDQLAENEPKLRALLAQVAQTEIRAPVSGYVFNLSQFTEGGVATQGQQLMQIVPANAKLVVTAEVSPKDIADVKVGMPAQVTLTAYSTHTTPPVEGHVTLVSADARINEKTGTSFFIAEVTITPEALAKAGPNVKLTPGMQAQVAIVTGSRSIMGYLIQPFTDAMHDSMREK